MDGQRQVVGRVEVGPFTQRVVEKAAWRGDGSPRSQATANDWERLLAWAESHSQFARFFTRLTTEQARQRDATIAEIRAAWFLESLGSRITSWEPAATNRLGEFEIQWPDSPPIFVEVKGPTWESELCEVERDRRKWQPKVCDGDGLWTGGASELEGAALKTMGKLAPDRPNLLVTVDDLFAVLVDRVDNPGVAEFLDKTEFAGLGGILMIDAKHFKSDSSGVDLKIRLELNPRAKGTRWELPSTAIQAILGSPASADAQ